MTIFQKTSRDEAAFRAFTEKVDKLAGTLGPYGDCADLTQLTAVKNRFEQKTADFYRADRKLNIGVIGQVKAGKSSFLNTLLFDGRKVLPSAATPKTATLTKIEYGEINRLHIEYYTPEEWTVLENNSRVDSQENEFVTAREIMQMVAEKGIVPAQYTGKGSDEFVFESSDDLMLRLNDYVGENGTYTALVKNVTIYMDRPELKDISVVDTPGLNDAIASRTDRTRQFIELCDVVFFLSRASQFMDKNDVKLLTSQLPQKGVKKLVMICSRFDDGLSDTIWDADSIEETISNTQKQLRTRAGSIISGMQVSPDLMDVLAPCKEPLFVSSMCWNMAQKTQDTYDAQENLVFENINAHGDVDQKTLERIGNVNSVRTIFDKVVAQKDETLSAKASSFVPSAESELRAVLSEMKQRAEQTLNILRTGDRNALEAQKRAAAYIEKAFYSALDITGVKRKLLHVIIENFDTSSEMYDAGMVRLITERTLNGLEFPVIKIDISKEQGALSSRFSGEIRDSSGRSALRTLLSEVLQKLIDSVTAQFQSELVSFKDMLNKLKASFADQLLSNIEAEFADLAQKFENKDLEIRTYEDFLTLLKIASKAT